MEFTTKKDLLLKSNYRGDARMAIRTSGSTGNPLVMYLNDIDINNITEIGAECFRAAGITSGMKVINTLSSQLWAGGTLDSISLYRAGACVFNFSTGNTKSLIELILSENIEAISCTPSYLSIIADVAKKEYGIKPDQLGLKLILCGGEAGIQNKDFRDNLENLFNATVVDANMGSAETVSIYASEDKYQKSGLIYRAGKIQSVKLLINGELVEPKLGLKGEAVLNTLYDGGLIHHVNYRTGDLFEILSDPINGNFRFKLIGRADEMIVVKGLNVYPDTIFNVVNKCKYEFGLNFNAQLRVSKLDPITEIQLHIQNPDCNNDNLTKEVINYLHTELKINSSLNIDVIVSNFENLMSANGKVKRIIRVL